MPCKTCRHMTPVYQLLRVPPLPRNPSASAGIRVREFMQAVTVVPAAEPQPEPAVDSGGEEWPEPSYPLEEPPSPRRRRRRR